MGTVVLRSNGERRSRPKRLLVGRVGRLAKVSVPATVNLTDPLASALSSKDVRLSGCRRNMGLVLSALEGSGRGVSVVSVNDLESLTTTFGESPTLVQSGMSEMFMFTNRTDGRSFARCGINLSMGSFMDFVRSKLSVC